MASKEQVATAVFALSEAFGRQISDGALELYWAALRDLADAQLQRSVARAARESRFMPAPAELREFGLGKGWKSREESGRVYAAMAARKKALPPVPATAEEIARSREETGLAVRALAEKADAGKALGPDPLVVTEEEKRAAIRAMELRLATSGGMG